MPKIVLICQFCSQKFEHYTTKQIQNNKKKCDECAREDTRRRTREKYRQNKKGVKND